ncbi:MAG: PEGA domain-containing protein [Turneriella sp.]
MKAVLLTMLCAAPCLFGATKPRTVAVLNFTNTSGAPSLDYLKSALPESVSATLSQNGSVKIVERAQITKVLSEIQLEQSGVLDGGEVSRAGKLSKADVLLIGQFSGNPEKLTVVLKAVDVTSGVVLDGRTVEAGLGDVLVQSGAAANSMMAIVSGRDLGYLTISSAPDDAEVLLDGALIGKTPIVEYKIAAGEHRLYLRKKSFKESETSVNINRGERKSISENLAPQRKAYAVHLGLGYQRLIPQSSVLTQGNVAVPRVGIAFGKFTVGAEMSILLNMNHSYTYDSAFGTTISMPRSYYYTGYAVTFDFEPFDNATYVSPFVGAFAGFTRISDYKGLANGTTEKILSEDVMQFGARAGIEFLPKMPVSIIIEGRYQTFDRNIKRTLTTSNGILGAPASNDTSLSFANFSIGGSVRFNF